MKFQPDKTDSVLITAYDASSIRIGGDTITQSFVLGSRGARFAWDAARFEDLTPEHFARLAQSQPELVIFGSGSTLQFPHPRLLAALMRARIGVETMDTPAACRTYNILAAEGRHVVGAFLIA